MCSSCMACDLCEKKNITITKAYAEEKMNRVNAQKLRA